MLSVIGTGTVIFLFDGALQADKTEAPPGSQFPPSSELKTELEAADLAETGATAVPYFPKKIKLPTKSSTTTPALPAGIGDAEEEYHLLGLGVRTVSFLSIKVYVVGLYVSARDVATLQSRFIRKSAEVDTASTLVSGEKERLKKRLGDPLEGEALWNDILKECGVRSVLRVVPTRNTDFAHLRDGWIRGITARSSAPTTAHSDQKFDDEEFATAIGQFKQLFSAAGRKNLEKGKVMLLEREANGGLVAWVQEGDSGRFKTLGNVPDERIGRLIWLGYLGGKHVSSEAARSSIVEGVMDIVERPVGTIETQVV